MAGTGNWRYWAAILRSVCLTSNKPLTMDEISSDVKMIQGRDIPYKSFNFKSMEDMVKSIPSLKVFYLNDKAVAEVIPIQNTKRLYEMNQKSLVARPKLPLKAPEIPSLGEWNFDVIVTMAAHPSSFTIQPRNTIMELEQLMSDLSALCAEYNGPFLSSSDVQVGNMYAVKCVDGRWYRAYVYKVLGKSMFAVYFCDFGDYKVVSLKQMQPLGNSLNVCAQNSSPLPSSEVKLGSMYAVKCDYDEKWHRAYVQRIMGKNLFAVYICDFEDYKVVSLEQLQPVAKLFYDLPWQAVKAKLHGVIPKVGGNWTVEDSLRFNDLVVNRSFVSKIKACDVDDTLPGKIVLSLELVDTSTKDVDIYIIQKLVEEKRAYRIEV